MYFVVKGSVWWKIMLVRSILINMIYRRENEGIFHVEVIQLMRLREVKYKQKVWFQEWIVPNSAIK